MNLRSHVRLVLLAHAANEAHRRGLFDPEGGGSPDLNRRGGMSFDASLPDGTPYHATLTGWFRDEARVAVALFPTKDSWRWTGVTNARSLAGDVVTSGFLTRGGLLHFDNIFFGDPYIHARRRAYLNGLRAPTPNEDQLGLYPSYLKFKMSA